MSTYTPAFLALLTLTAGACDLGLDDEPNGDRYPEEIAIEFDAPADVVAAPDHLDRLPGDIDVDPVIGDDVDDPAAPVPPAPVAVPAPRVYWTFDVDDRSDRGVRERVRGTDLTVPEHTAERARIFVPHGMGQRGEFAPQPDVFAEDITIAWFGDAERSGLPALGWSVLEVGQQGSAFELGYGGGRGRPSIYVGHGRVRNWLRVPDGGHMFTLVRDANAGLYHLYMDGVHHQTARYTNPIVPAPASGSLGLDGWLDDVAVFDRALDADQVRELWVRAAWTPGAPRGVDTRPFELRPMP